MFGLSAKERLAQLQQKGSKDSPVGKLSAGLKPTPGKLGVGPGQLKKPEPLKPAADLKKPLAQQPVKPKEEPKKPEPVKPKEEPKTPAVQEPAKPKEEPKVPVAPEPAKSTEEPKTSAAPEPAKPKEDPAKPAVPEAAKPKEEPAKPAAPEPAKPKEEPAKPAAPEPAKPKEEPKTSAAPAKPKKEPAKPAAPEPAKPKEEPKTPAAPAKPKEEPAKPAAPEPSKPKEEPKKAAAPEPAKSKEEPKKAAAPEPAKPKEESKKAAPEPAKPTDEPKKAAAPVAAKSADAVVKPVVEPATVKQVEESKKLSDDFFRSIFYFSGMGTLVGSALAEGVYVPEKTQRNALDSDEIESARERQRLRRGEEIIVTARNQAQGLSTDFRHLQALLESLPTFTEAFESQPLDRRGVDQVIHGHVYFQQEQHHAPTHSRPVHHQELTSQAAEIASHVPQHHHHHHHHEPAHVVAEAKRAPVGGVPVMPDVFDQRHRPKAADQHKGETASFAAAIDEFDRATSAYNQQQPLFAALPPRPPSEPSQPHPRERPTTGEEHGKGGGGGPASRPTAVPHTAVPPSTQPWQERYGQAEVAKFAAPRPFSASPGGEIDSKGIKSWQMSHLRTLEAKGYHIVSDSEQDGIKSYSPYLVSDRSHGADRQHHHQHRGGGPSPTAAAAVEPPVSATTYRPPAASNSPFAQALEDSVGYSDL